MGKVKARKPEWAVRPYRGRQPYPPKSANPFLVSFVERDQTNSNG